MTGLDGRVDRNAHGHRIITSASNPLIKRAASLREKKYRRREGLFLAEGLRILTEAHETGVVPQQLFYAEDGGALHPLAQSLIAATMAAGGDVIATTAHIVSRLTGKDNPQTLVGLYPDHLTPLTAIDRSAAPVWLVAQAMRDPGNLGTLLRTGDAVGGGGVILIDDCVDPFSVETVRASMGAIFTQRIVTARWPDFVAWVRSGPGTVVATTLASDSVDYRRADYPDPTFIVIGNEARGLPADYAAMCDVRVTMPMRGKADSLNASIAAAIMAYHVRDWQEGHGAEPR